MSGRVFTMEGEDVTDQVAEEHVAPRKPHLGDIPPVTPVEQNIVSAATAMGQGIDDALQAADRLATQFSVAGWVVVGLVALSVVEGIRELR